MKRLKKIICGLLALVTFGTFGACNGTGDKEVFVEDNVTPISIEDNWSADKVKTSGFTLPTTPTEKKEDFELSSLVAKYMLLQANVTTRIWGKIKASGVNEVAVQVIRAEETHVYYGDVDGEGNFTVYVGAEDYAASCTLRIIADNGSAYTVEQVAFGELFVCGGQSNMGWTMSQCYEERVGQLKYQEDIDNSANPSIRIFHVVNAKSSTPTESVSGSWKKATPSSVKDTSAAAYYYAKELNAQYEVPVGVVVSCMGGTGIVSWTPEEYLDEYQGDHASNPETSQWYNGRIYPIRNLVPRGVLWYQGEGENATTYVNNYKLMMRAWREVFGKNDIFFTTIQLPRYKDQSGYFLRREAQKQASEEDAYATYSVNIDLGLYPENVATGDDLNGGGVGQTLDGIHPYDKKPVGIRAAHATMDALYGAQGVWRGPTLKSVQVKGNKVILTFSNVGKGLALHGTFGFEIAGNGQTFTMATPTLQGTNQVVLTAEGVTNPTMVRYGFVNGDTAAMETCAESVCLWNTKTGNDQAYPAEQFLWKKS